MIGEGGREAVEGEYRGWGWEVLWESMGAGKYFGQLGYHFTGSTEGEGEDLSWAGRDGLQPVLPGHAGQAQTLMANQRELQFIVGSQFKNDNNVPMYGNTH